MAAVDVRAPSAPVPVSLPVLSNVVVSGWLRHSAVQALIGYVGSLPSLCVEVGGDVFGSGRVVPGAEGSNAEGVAWWNGESEGNWLYAWLGHVALVGSSEDREVARTRVRHILAHQDPDGYLGMFSPDHRRHGTFITGDLWTQTCLTRALRLWADAEHDEAIHRALDRAVHATMARLSTAFERGAVFVGSARTGHDLMFVDALYESHVRSPDAAYGQCAVRLFDAFSAARIDHPFADFQRSRLLSDEPISGHGAHVAEHARIPLLIATMTGDPDGQWGDLFQRGIHKLTPAIGSSGGLKSDETVGAPGQSPVHLAESGEEHCALTEFVATAVAAATITGDPAWLERAETIMLNAAPAGVLANGTAVAYLHAENQILATRALGTRWDYSPTHDDAAVCCAPNAGRLLPLVAPHMIVGTATGYRVQLYGPVQATFPSGQGGVTIRQSTDFPFEEDVEIRVMASDARFTLELRIPSWCSEPTVRMSDVYEAITDQREGYIVIAGVWTTSSRVTLTLPQRIQTSETADGRTSVALGPLTLALPITHAATPTRGYPGSQLADLDITPADKSFRLPPVLREENLSTAVVKRTADSDRNWADVGVVVHLRMIDPTPRSTATTGAEDREIELVPIGATTLRWAVFPMVRASNSQPSELLPIGPRPESRRNRDPDP